MNASRNDGWRRSARQLFASAVLAVCVLAATTVAASAATTATFSSGVLTVFGDSADNSIVISRDAAGKILVNGGAITVVGGTPTVANTSLIQVFGQGGQDVVTLNEANGALPAAHLFGGAGNDTLTGGSGGDRLFGQTGNDTLLGTSTTLNPSSRGPSAASTTSLSTTCPGLMSSTWWPTSPPSAAATTASPTTSSPTPRTATTS